MLCPALMLGVICTIHLAASSERETDACSPRNLAGHDVSCPTNPAFWVCPLGLKTEPGREQLGDAEGGAADVWRRV
jgi:hypothetical protein